MGREPELAELRRRWRRAQAGAGGFALLTGPPGSGKTALVGAVADEVAADGGLVLAGRCAAGEAVPAGALRGAIDRYAKHLTTLPDAERRPAVDRARRAAGDGGHLLAPLSATLAGLIDLPVPDATDQHDQFVTATADFLAELARAHGGLFIQLDDVPWLDPVGCQVLRRLAENLADTPLLVVATARTNDGDGEAFRAACGGRLDLSRRIGALAGDDVARLVSAYLAGAGVSPELISEVAVRGRGNPFTILEYLRAMVDAGVLRPQWGTWVLDAELLQGVELPEEVLDLVLSRIDGLGEAGRLLLTSAAAIGSWFTPAVLAAVAGHDPAAELAAAVERGVLQQASGRSTDVAWRGLADAGCPLPQNTFAIIAWTLGHLLWWIIAGSRRPSPRPATGERRERLRLAVGLCSVLGTNMYMNHRPAWTVPLGLHSARLGAELGRSAEYASGQIGLASLAAMLRMLRRRDRYHREAVAVAAEVGDPAIKAYVAYVWAVIESVICGGPRAELPRVAEANRRWLDPDYYLNIVSMRCMELAARGAFPTGTRPARARSRVARRR